MNSLLNDYYTRERDAMDLYRSQQAAAQSNAYTARMSGGQAPDSVMTAMPGGMVNLPSLMPAAPGASPYAGETSQMGGGVPFGGFRAKGGPVLPGRAYIVGERGPELMVPELPGRVLPNEGGMRPLTDFNPVNGKTASFDGMSRTQFFGGNMGKTAGTGTPVYNDIRGLAAGQAPRPDPRSFGTGGMNFMGPPVPTRVKPTLDATTGKPVDFPFGAAPIPQAPNPMRPATGMLVPSSTGGVKWQPGTGPGTTLPPQSMVPASPPMMPMGMPFGMPAPGTGSRIPQSPMNRPYAELPGGTGSLANRPTRAIGRSANDPQRIAEQMRRRGDPRAIMHLGMQRMGQDFARERDAVNFAQGQMAFGQQQAVMDARDERNFQQQQQMFGLQQGAINERDAVNFEQQMRLEEERRAAEAAGQEQARQFGLKPVPAPGTATPYFQDAQGRIYAGSQPEQAPEPMPKGLVPKGYQNGKAIYGQPDTPQGQRFQLRELPGEQVQDPKTKAWTTKPGQMVRVFEDGTYEPLQPRGQPKAAATPPPVDAAARLEALRKKAGL